MYTICIVYTLCILDNMYSLYILYTIHYVLSIHYVYLILYVLSLVQGLGLYIRPHDIQPNMDHIERRPGHYLDTLASPYHNLHGRTDDHAYHAYQCLSIYLLLYRL